MIYYIKDVNRLLIFYYIGTNGTYQLLYRENMLEMQSIKVTLSKPIIFDFRKVEL